MRLKLLLLILLIPAGAAAVEIEPFSGNGRAPLTASYGIPTTLGTSFLPRGTFETRLVFDTANTFSHAERSDEAVFLDGETYRTTLRFRHAVTPTLEWGGEVPYVVHRGGFLDRFIEGWHETFSLPNGNREYYDRNRLAYRYVRNGRTLVNVTDAADGIGDLSLNGRWRFVASADGSDSATIRMAVKAPTGSRRNLTGSGTTDVTLLVEGRSEGDAPGGRLGTWGGIGAVAVTGGGLLSDIRNPVIGFFTAGIGWSPGPLALKVQLDGHTAPYRSELRQLGMPMLQLTVGGTVELPAGMTLDLGVAEDVAVETAPDVVFHLSLSARF